MNVAMYECVIVGYMNVGTCECVNVWMHDCRDVCMHMNLGMYEVETEHRKRGRYPMSSL